MSNYFTEQKHLSCCLLETLEQSVIDNAKGVLPTKILRKLDEVADMLFEYNQYCVKKEKEAQI